MEARRLSRRIGATACVHDADLTIRSGSSTCIVGPSGSGKTSLLRLLAGLDQPDSGRVLLDGVDITATAPHERPVAMVFQHDTLFPELTVAENVAFGLRGRGLSRARRDEAVALSLLRLGLTGLEQRYPNQLSGGQQRRVAVARALAVRPRVLLLDEPMSGLDEPLRAQLSLLLRQLQERWGLAVVHVTHDQPEALGSATSLAVMEHGSVRQQDDPEHVFTRPQSTSVAAFLGRSTFLQADVVAVHGDAGGARARVRVLGHELDVAAHDALLPDQPEQAPLLVRPHTVRLEPAPPPRTPGGVDPFGDIGVIQQRLYRGDRLDFIVETERGNLLVTASLTTPVRPGDAVRLILDADQAWLLPQHAR